MQNFKNCIKSDKPVKFSFEMKEDLRLEAWTALSYFVIQFSGINQ